ncbi:dihydroneopterin aldolase [Desulfurobacterium crinifex]
MTRRSVFIEGMKLYVKCGVFEEERKLGVQILMDVKVESKEFVDYQELHNLILTIVNKNQFTYLEELGESLLNKIKGKWHPELVIIRIAKLSMPFQNSFSKAGIEIIWEKDGKTNLDMELEE